VLHVEKDIGEFRLPADWADDPIFSVRPYCRRAAWLWLIQHAVNGEVKGPLSAIAEIWKWDAAIVERFASLLASRGLVSVSETGIRIIGHDRFAVPVQAVQKERVTQAEFDQWWAGWPHKVGKDEARKAYGRARQKVSCAELLAGAGRYREAKAASVPWCNPATWLNQGRWSDEPSYASAEPLGAAGVQEKVSVMNYAEPWPQRLSGFQRSGFWIVHMWGPRPGDSGCRVPRDLLSNQ